MRGRPGSRMSQDRALPSGLSASSRQVSSSRSSAITRWRTTRSSSPGLSSGLARLAVIAPPGGAFQAKGGEGAMVAPPMATRPPRRSFATPKIISSLLAACCRICDRSQARRPRNTCSQGRSRRTSSMDIPDLRYLPPPIEGRPPQDHALVSLLRDGERRGLRLPAGVLSTSPAPAPAPRRGSRRTPCASTASAMALFHAGGSGDVAYLCEGYCCKPLAVASLGARHGVRRRRPDTCSASRCRPSAPS